MFGWFMTVSQREALEDLKKRLVSSQKDADYWRNEYGNKVAELQEAVDARDQAEKNLQTAKALIADQEGKIKAAEASAKQKDVVIEQAKARWKETAKIIDKQAAMIKDRIECYPI
jgi:chromosome segregation ATPase